MCVCRHWEWHGMHACRCDVLEEECEHTPVHGRAARGALHRKCPTGGCAYLKSNTMFVILRLTIYNICKNELSMKLSIFALTVSQESDRPPRCHHVFPPCRPDQRRASALRQPVCQRCLCLPSLTAQATTPSHPSWQSPSQHVLTREQGGGVIARVQSFLLYLVYFYVFNFLMSLSDFLTHSFRQKSLYLHSDPDSQLIHTE